MKLEHCVRGDRKGFRNFHHRVKNWLIEVDPIKGMVLKSPNKMQNETLKHDKEDNDTSITL